MSLFSEIFVWWQGNTLGTRLTTWRNGECVGEDEQGNKYYRSRKGRDRRWVIYTGDHGGAEASRVPPAWYSWLHHTTNVLPGDEDYVEREWTRPHEPNMTGTPQAYHPGGSLLAHSERQKTAGDYEPWTPGD